MGPLALHAAGKAPENPDIEQAPGGPRKARRRLNEYGDSHDDRSFHYATPILSSHRGAQACAAWSALSRAGRRPDHGNQPIRDSWISRAVLARLARHLSRSSAQLPAAARRSRTLGSTRRRAGDHVACSQKLIRDTQNEFPLRVGRTCGGVRPTIFLLVSSPTQWGFKRSADPVR